MFGRKNGKKDKSMKNHDSSSHFNTGERLEHSALRRVIPEEKVNYDLSETEKAFQAMEDALLEAQEEAHKLSEISSQASFHSFKRFSDILEEKQGLVDAREEEKRNAYLAQKEAYEREEALKQEDRRRSEEVRREQQKNLAGSFLSKEKSVRKQLQAKDTYAFNDKNVSDPIQAEEKPVVRSFSEQDKNVEEQNKDRENFKEPMSLAGQILQKEQHLYEEYASVEDSEEKPSKFFMKEKKESLVTSLAEKNRREKVEDSHDVSSLAQRKQEEKRELQQLPHVTRIPSSSVQRLDNRKAKDKDAENLGVAQHRYREPQETKAQQAQITHEVSLPLIEKTTHAPTVSLVSPSTAEKASPASVPVKTEDLPSQAELHAKLLKKSETGLSNLVESNVKEKEDSSNTNLSPVDFTPVEDIESQRTEEEKNALTEQVSAFFEDAKNQKSSPWKSYLSLLVVLVLLVCAGLYFGYYVYEDVQNADTYQVQIAAFEAHPENEIENPSQNWSDILKHLEVKSKNSLFAREKYLASYEALTKLQTKLLHEAKAYLRTGNNLFTAEKILAMFLQTEEDVKDIDTLVKEKMLLFFEDKITAGEVKNLLLTLNRLPQLEKEQIYLQDIQLLQDHQIDRKIQAFWKELKEGKEKKSNAIFREIQEDIAKLSLSEESLATLKNLEAYKDAVLSYHSLEQALATLDEGKYYRADRLLKKLQEQVDLSTIPFVSVNEQTLDEVGSSPKTLADSEVYKKLKEELEAHNLETVSPYQGQLLVFKIQSLLSNFASTRSSGLFRQFTNHNFTAEGFKTLLAELYANQYVLVNPKDAYDEENAYWKLELPEGKKALVLYIDDLAQVEDRARPYFPSSLTLNKEGTALIAYNKQGEEMEGALAMNLVEDFLKEHPDFSFDEARPILRVNDFQYLQTMLGLVDQSTSAVYQWIQNHHYKLAIDSDLLEVRYQSTEEAFASALAKVENKLKLQSISSYFFANGEWSRTSDTKKDLLIEKGILVDAYVSNDPQEEFQDTSVQLGALDMRPWILYKNTYGHLFDNAKIYDSMVKEGYYYSAR